MFYNQEIQDLYWATQGLYKNRVGFRADEFLGGFWTAQVAGQLYDRWSGRDAAAEDCGFSDEGRARMHEHAMKLKAEYDEFIGKYRIVAAEASHG